MYIIIIKLTVTILINTIFSLVYTENIKPDQLRLKEMYAVRVSTPPVLDGILDDEAWKTAVPNSDFLQFRPVLRCF